ncbi:MAG: response regulator transcription factor, partial [Rhodospirillaceae bacterium]|nr:response regulator transcription factor [Rhodospirillaceae bacterium]
LLRLGSILRRVPRDDPGPSRELRLGEFIWDMARSELRCNDQPVHLTQAERDLLAILAEVAGQGVSRDDLAVRTGNSANPRTVDVQVTRLRKKIEDDPKLPRYLQTVRGM